MQGFNMGRYVPPDVEGTTSGNRLNKKHALGSRASKLASHGILTVRFEMPYAVWCASCPKPTIIGQGVRFNAEKKRVGNYHSTPIWSFTFRHVDCGGSIEMRTDPKNTAYVVVAGGTKRDTGDERRNPDDGDLVIMTDAERDALRSNAFASLEKTIEDRQRLELASERIHDLMDASAKHWDDPYTQNQRLRKAFRIGRKEREREGAAAEDLKDRMSLGIDLLPESELDSRRAALVDFGSLDDDDDDDNGGGNRTKDKALSKPLFDTVDSQVKKKPRGSKLKAEKEVSKRKDTLVSELMGNTRAAKDPFLMQNRGITSKPPTRLPGVKRKRSPPETPEPPKKMPAQEPGVSNTNVLVNYDSD